MPLSLRPAAKTVEYANASSSSQSTHELILAGSKATKNSWLRVCDNSERTFFHNIRDDTITLERPLEFGDGNPMWADGKQGAAQPHKSSRCNHVTLVRTRESALCLLLHSHVSTRISPQYCFLEPSLWVRRPTQNHTWRHGGGIKNQKTIQVLYVLYCIDCLFRGR